MTTAVRQYFSVPNTNTTSVFTSEGSFKIPTLPGSTIVVIGTYSDDITTPGTCSDTQNQSYLSAVQIDDTSPPTKGHQNFQALVQQNSKVLSPSDVITYKISGTDFMGMTVAEIAGVPPASLVDAVGTWQQNISGSKPNNLTSGPVAITQAGEYFALACSVNTSDLGGSAPYAPTPGNEMTLVNNWFNDTAVGGAMIGTVASKLVNATAGQNIAAHFTSPPASNSDNFVTLILLFNTAPAVQDTTPFTGTVTVGSGAQTQTASFSGTIPATVNTAQVNAFSGNLQISGASGTFSGSLPANGGGPPPPPAPTITGISPNSTVVDSPSVNVTINGTGFVAASEVDLNGDNLNVQFVSSTQLVATIPASMLTSTGTDNMYVVNPASAGGESNAAQFTVTPASTGGVPVPPPDASPVYYNGKFYWAGDWSGIAGINYSAPGGVSGGNCIAIPKAGQYEYWLPYPPVTAGSPATNGIGCNLTGKTKFTIAVKPSVTGLNLSMGFYEANATQVDIPFGSSVNITQQKYCVYGPGTPTAGEWSVFEVPLADFNIGTPGWIYKFIDQEQGAEPQAVNIDLCYFS
jgi:hypothetical protein